MNDFAAATRSKTAVGILSLLRMPFRQGALILVFQVVFQLLREPFAAIRAYHGAKGASNMSTNIKSPIEINVRAAPQEDPGAYRVPGASALAQAHRMAPVTRAQKGPPPSDYEAGEQAERDACDRQNAHKNAVADGVPCPPDCFWCEQKGRSR